MNKEERLYKKFDDALGNYINGNSSDFRNFVKGLSKLNMLKFIEFAQSNGTHRHAIIASIEVILEGK